MEGNLAIFAGLPPRHLGAAQPAGDQDTDSVSAHPHRPLDRLANGPLRRDPLLDLLRDRFGDELRVYVGVTDLLYVDVDLFRR